MNKSLSILKVLSLLLVSFGANTLIASSADAHTRCKVWGPRGTWTEGCLHSHPPRVEFHQVGPRVVKSPFSLQGNLCANQKGTGTAKARFAREIVVKNNTAFIRCSELPNATVNLGRYWTRQFISTNGQNISGTDATCAKTRFVNEIVYRRPNKLYIRCREIIVGGKRAQWATGGWSYPFLSLDSKKLKTASCPNDAVIAQVVKSSKNNTLYIKCRRVKAGGKTIKIDEKRYWTSKFMTIN
ncbi:hypothetical protein ACSYAD_33115 [Acaryochloris marina NIES-2412]|uniref:hypothetical protein n=1 Tax=Acaryochloris marina TaxID=155978 RepID=UPI00405812DF